MSRKKSLFQTYLLALVDSIKPCTLLGQNVSLQVNGIRMLNYHKNRESI